MGAMDTRSFRSMPGRPIRLGFGTPGGGYADPSGTQRLGPISNKFELTQSGFRFVSEGGGRIDASWNAAEQVFDLDI